MNNKFVPRTERKYLVTDQCYFEVNPPASYNPYDPKRKPHAIELVDVETGTVVQLPSGSIIKIVSVRDEDLIDDDTPVTHDHNDCTTN